MSYLHISRFGKQAHPLYSRCELTAFFCISILLVASCNTVFGPPDSDEVFPVGESRSLYPYDTLVQGQPNLSLITVRGGLYLWNIGKDWHVRLTRPDTFHRATPFPPVFEGSILLQKADVDNISVQNISPRNYVRSGLKDIVFRFESGDKIGGFDFTIAPHRTDYCLYLDIRFNGIPSPDLVHLGQSMHIADTLPLPICFH